VEEDFDIVLEQTDAAVNRDLDITIKQGETSPALRDPLASLRM